jgi:hypothetical protein
MALVPFSFLIVAALVGVHPCIASAHAHARSERPPHLVHFEAVHLSEVELMDKHSRYRREVAGVDTTSTTETAAPVMVGFAAYGERFDLELHHNKGLFIPGATTFIHDDKGVTTKVIDTAPWYKGQVNGT